MTADVEVLGINQLVIAGTLAKTARLTKSPAGIPHLHFSIEHRSMQTEAGLSRQCYARIQVVASGDWTLAWSEQLTLGSVVKVAGFIQRHEDKNGMGKLVLHAQKIEQV